MASDNIQKSFRFRIYPTHSQTTKLQDTLNLCRELYNAALQERRDAYKLQKISLNYHSQANQLREIKEIREDLKAVHSQVLQEVLKRVEKAFDNFFRRVKEKKGKAGFPRFQGFNRYNSFTFPQSGFQLKDGKLHLSKLGHFKIKQHREIQGKIKTLTISRSRTGKWFVCFSCEVEKQPLEKTNKTVGVDVGLKTFAVLSDGSEIDNPRFFCKEEKNLAKAQRALSKTAKKSKERKKRRKTVAKIHERIKNKRANFAHQISRNLVNEFDVICFEKLNVPGMVKNHHLAKSIQDASWSRLIQYVTYKAEYAGRKTILVNPKNTSQMCSRCGYIVKKDLSVRVHNCKNCGLSLCRDANAAINIQALGLQSVGVKAIEAASL